MDTRASAKPRKRFFVEMFTRDISLQDCILDLVDNSIDAYIRQQQIDLRTDLLPGGSPPSRRGLINVTVDVDAVEIRDDCGGIPFEKAKNEVFNFGHSTSGISDLTHRGLGAYGVGMKRAIFKMGKSFTVESNTLTDGFRVSEDLGTWLEKDEDISDWTFPLEARPAALSASSAGTSVRLSPINDELRSLVASEEFLDDLKSEIARAYSLFLDRHISIQLNGTAITGKPIPLAAETNETKPATESWTDGEVEIALRVGLAAPDDGRWIMENAGWYVLCNGRVVVSADKTELTGWGAGILPQFHTSKSRGFVGVAMFYSENPVALPWTTTKRGLNRESMIFIRTRQKMQSVARPVYSYLDSLYKTKTDEDAAMPTPARALVPASTSSLATSTNTVFTPPRTRARKYVTKVQYDAQYSELEAVRKHLHLPSMPANRIGRHTFDYFMEQEGLA